MGLARPEEGSIPILVARKKPLVNHGGEAYRRASRLGQETVYNQLIEMDVNGRPGTRENRCDCGARIGVLANPVIYLTTAQCVQVQSSTGTCGIPRAEFK
jgi:hypothetical protein